MADQVDPFGKLVLFHFDGVVIYCCRAHEVKRSGKRGPVRATAKDRSHWPRLRRAALASRAQNHLI